MIYLIAYKTASGITKYVYERDRHTAMDMADAAITAGFNDLVIHYDADAEALAVADILKWREVKATNCRAYGENIYSGQETLARDRLLERSQALQVFNLTGQIIDK